MILRFNDQHTSHAFPSHYLGFDMHGWFPALQDEKAKKYYTLVELKNGNAFMDLNPRAVYRESPVGNDPSVSGIIDAKASKKADGF